MEVIKSFRDRIHRYKKRLRDPVGSGTEDYLRSQLAKFKFWAPIYDFFFTLQTIGRTRKVRDSIVNRVGGEKGKILDVCCGTGSVSVALAQKFPKAKIYGLDVSPHMLKKAQKKAAKEQAKNVEFIEANAQKMPFENDMFDAVINSFGLHEMPVKIMADVMGEMARVLKKDGQLLLMDYQRPTTVPLRLIFDVLMFFWEPRGTFLYCNEKGILNCFRACANGHSCFEGFGVNHFKTSKCWRTSAVIYGKKEDDSCETQS